MKRITFDVDEKFHKKIKMEALRLNKTIKQLMVKLLEFHFHERESK